MSDPQSAPSAEVQAQIAGLFVYPIKSCAGVALNEAVLTETGLDLDRAWMVVDTQGEFVSQRELPRLALVQVQLKWNEVILRAPGMLSLHLHADRVEAATRARVWDDEVPAYLTEFGLLAVDPDGRTTEDKTLVEIGCGIGR